MFMNREENLFTNKSNEKYMYNYKYLFLNQVVKPFKLYTFSITTDVVVLTFYSD